jgi:hypothetical protein
VKISIFSDDLTYVCGVIIAWPVIEVIIAWPVTEVIIAWPVIEAVKLKF